PGDPGLPGRPDQAQGTPDGAGCERGRRDAGDQPRRGRPGRAPGSRSPRRRPVTTPTGGPSLFGGIGRPAVPPTNKPDDPFPTWVDITPYVRTELTPLTITRGRQSELDVIQPGTLSCILDNSDGRFTFGLTSGPYGANWAPAKKIRYSETLG